jgi:predicted NBD/HSP70 family sugar kinase
MLKKKKKNRSSIGVIRSRDIVRLVFDRRGAITREQVIAATRASEFSIYRIISRLMEHGILQELPEGLSRGGRRSRFLTVNPALGCVIGSCIDEEFIKIGLYDAVGNTLKAQTVTMRTTAGPEILEEYVRNVRSFCREAASRRRVFAVGLGVPGILDRMRTTGMFTSLYSEWRNLPIQRILQEQLRMPVYLEHNATLAALAEFQEHRRDAASLIYIDVDRGVGMGVIMDGKVFHGGQGMASEFGHMIISENGPMCACGNRGCIGAMVNIGTILEQVRAIVRSGVVSDVDERGITFDSLVTHFAAGDRIVTDVVRNAVRLLCIGISNLVHVYSPQVIVIGGRFARFGQPLQTLIVQEMQKLFWNAIRHLEPVIKVSPVEENQVHGAALFALENVYTHQAEEVVP